MSKAPTMKELAATVSSMENRVQQLEKARITKLEHRVMELEDLLPNADTEKPEFTAGDTLNEILIVQKTKDSTHSKIVSSKPNMRDGIVHAQQLAKNTNAAYGVYELVGYAQTGPVRWVDLASKKD